MNTHCFCAPIFITDEFGLSFNEQHELISTNSDYPSIRNGTVTFVEFNNDFFAITCNHVLTVLKDAQLKWKVEQKEKYGFEPPIEGAHFFTPKANNQYHFCYEFYTAQTDTDFSNLDIAIARIDPFVMERLDRRALSLNDQIPSSPVSAIASGYPEIQRAEYDGSNTITRTFSPKFVTCTANLGTTSADKLHLQDTIEEHCEVDNLSGMSGGPIIWSQNDSNGLAGIITVAPDIQPVSDGIYTESTISIFGEKITPKIFQKWLEHIPEKLKLHDFSKYLYIPPDYKV